MRVCGGKADFIVDVYDCVVAGSGHLVGLFRRLLADCVWG